MKSQPVPPLAARHLVIPTQTRPRGSIYMDRSALEPLIADAGTALAHRGRLSLAVDPAHADSGPVFIDPVARAWFGALTDAWPYWSFFASRDDVTITHVLTLLLPGRVIDVPDGRTGWKFELDELQPLLVRLLGAQAALVRRLGIDPRLHEEAIGTFFAAARNVIR